MLTTNLRFLTVHTYSMHRESAELSILSTRATDILTAKELSFYALIDLRDLIDLIPIGYDDKELSFYDLIDLI